MDSKTSVGARGSFSSLWRGILARIARGVVARMRRTPFSFLKEPQSCSVLVKVVMDFCFPVSLATRSSRLPLLFFLCWAMRDMLRCISAPTCKTLNSKP